MGVEGERVSVRKLCEEEATEEEKAEAAGAELKTKTPHNDVGNYLSFLSISKIIEISFFNAIRILPQIGFRSGPCNNRL